MNNTFQGSVLAPDATINIHHNLDGNIVAEQVNVVGGETHRWDLQDNNNIVTVPEEPGEPDENNEGNELVDPGFTIDPTPTSPEPDPDGNVDDDDQEIIINGGSEGNLDLNGSNEGKTLSSINGGSGLVPLTNTAQSNDTSSASGSSRLPQAGATSGILMTVVGVIMLGLGVVFKKVRMDK